MTENQKPILKIGSLYKIEKIVEKPHVYYVELIAIRDDGIEAHIHYTNIKIPWLCDIKTYFFPESKNNPFAYTEFQSFEEMTLDWIIENI